MWHGLLSSSIINEKQDEFDGKRNFEGPVEHGQPLSFEMKNSVSPTQNETFSSKKVKILDHIG